MTHYLYKNVIMAGFFIKIIHFCHKMAVGMQIEKR